MPDMPTSSRGSSWGCRPVGHVGRLSRSASYVLTWLVGRRCVRCK